MRVRARACVRSRVHPRAERPRILLASTNVILLGVADVLEGQNSKLFPRATRKCLWVWHDASVTVLVRRVTPLNDSMPDEGIVGSLTEQHLCTEPIPTNEAWHRREEKRSHERLQLGCPDQPQPPPKCTVRFLELVPNWLRI